MVERSGLGAQCLSPCTFDGIYWLVHQFDEACTIYQHQGITSRRKVWHCASIGRNCADCSPISNVSVAIVIGRTWEQLVTSPIGSDSHRIVGFGLDLGHPGFASKRYGPPSWGNRHVHMADPSRIEGRLGCNRNLRPHRPVSKTVDSVGMGSDMRPWQTTVLDVRTRSSCK